MVHLPSKGSCVDRFEWPNRRGSRPLLGATATPSTFDKQKGVVMDAESLCASVGKRLCRNDEWETACRGPKGSDYPFGPELPEPDPDQSKMPCNFWRPFIEPNEKKVWARDPAEMARLDQSDPAGARGCRSASGAEDLMANAEEWVSCPDWLSKQCDESTGRCYCLMGRYWSDPAKCSRVVTSHAPTWHYYETGFRCCSDAVRSL